MSGRVKKSGYKNGQGYCGWYTNRDGKKLFLRSTKEFIYANYLDSLGMHFLTEKAIFEISGKMYKPDFFIYNETYNSLIKIIEIKDTKKKAIFYIDSFRSFFEGINIKYEVAWEFRKIVKDLGLKNKIEEWIRRFEITYNRLSVSGKNNPMWGMHHNKKTKDLIGSRTKEYMQDPEIKRKHSSSIRAFWNSDEALKIKEKYRNLRHEEKNKRDREINVSNPSEDKKCILCGNIFVDRRLSNKKTCSSSCSQKYDWKIGLRKYCGDGKKSYRSKIVKYSKKIFSNNIGESEFYNAVKNAKDIGVIPKNFSISENIVNKYFGSFDKLMWEVKNG